MVGWMSYRPISPPRLRNKSYEKVTRCYGHNELWYEGEQIYPPSYYADRSGGRIGQPEMFGEAALTVGQNLHASLNLGMEQHFSAWPKEQDQNSFTRLLYVHYD